MIKTITTEELIKKTDIDYNVWKKLTKDEKAELEHKKTKLENAWKLGLFKNEGAMFNPRREKCFSLAWEYRHSNGYKEVENYFIELVELIK